MINLWGKILSCIILLIAVSINSVCSAKTKNDNIQDFLITENFIAKNKMQNTIQQQQISDFLITKNFISENPPVSLQNKTIITDDFMKELLKDCEYQIYEQKKYNFQNVNHIYVKIRPITVISTKNPINNGDKVFFVVTKDVIFNGNLIVKKGEKVSAKVETISERGTYGVAADIIIGNFQLGKIRLIGEISKEGFTHSYWVIPISQAAGFFIPLANYAFRFIRGGHAKITPKDTFEIQLPDEFCQNMKANTL